MYFIGIDAGGTKTAFVLADRDASPIARHQAGGCAFLADGPDRLTKLLDEGIASLCRQAAIGLGDITYVALGIPGYGEKAGADREIMAACERAGLAGRIKCECDCYIAWAGSLALKPGINVISGTGSICYGVNAAGQTARTSGWGAHCDEGSCRWLGEKLLALFAKQSDGRLPRTVLYDEFRRHFDLDEDLHFIHTLNHGLSYPDTARLQLLLGRIYDAGDHHARSLYETAADELALAAWAAAAKLGLADDTYDVSYSGGLFRAGEKILAPFRRQVASRGGRVVAPRHTPEIGAVLVAMAQSPSGPQ